MNLAKYTAMRFTLFFGVFALLIMTCSTLWPGMQLGKWYTISGLALLLTAFEFYRAKQREPISQCIGKQHLQELKQVLVQLGYKHTDQNIDSMVFLRRIHLLYWDVAKVEVKQNCLVLELPEKDIRHFNSLAIGFSKPEGSH